MSYQVKPTVTLGYATPMTVTERVRELDVTWSTDLFSSELYPRVFPGHGQMNLYNADGVFALGGGGALTDKQRFNVVPVTIEGFPGTTTTTPGTPGTPPVTTTRTVEDASWVESFSNTPTRTSGTISPAQTVRGTTFIQIQVYANGRVQLRASTDTGISPGGALGAWQPYTLELDGTALAFADTTGRDQRLLQWSGQTGLYTRILGRNVRVRITHTETTTTPGTPGTPPRTTTTGGIDIWKGYAQLELGRTTRGPSGVATFRLLDQMGRRFREPVQVSHPEQTTLAEVISEFAAQTGITVSNTTPALNLGILIDYEDTLLEFIHRVAETIDGYSTIDHEGNVALWGHAERAAATADLSIDEATHNFASPVVYGPLTLSIENVITALGTRITGSVQVHETASLPASLLFRPQEEGTAGVNVSLVISRDWDVQKLWISELTHADGRVLTFTETTGALIDRPVYSSGRLEGLNEGYTHRITPAGEQLLTITLSRFWGAPTHAKVSIRYYEATGFETATLQTFRNEQSIEDYGERPPPFGRADPPWYRAGVVSQLQAEVDRRGEPSVRYVVDHPLHAQPSETVARNLLTKARSGAVVSLNAPSRDGISSVKMIQLATNFRMTDGGMESRLRQACLKL